MVVDTSALDFDASREALLALIREKPTAAPTRRSRTWRSPAALRAAEIEADVILLAKNVDGVYDSDPATNPQAVRFDELTHMEVVEKDLKVMDLTAATLCKDNHIIIHVFAIAEEGNVVKAIAGEKIGTIIK